MFVAALVRFRGGDCIDSRPSHADDLSRVHCAEFRGVIEDWKTGVTRRSMHVEKNKLIGQMSQSTPQIMNGITGYKTNLRRRRFEIVYREIVISCLRIKVPSKCEGSCIN